MSKIIAGIGYGLSFSLVAEIVARVLPGEWPSAAGLITHAINELGGALGIPPLALVAAVCIRLFGPGMGNTLNEALARARPWPVHRRFRRCVHAPLSVRDVALTASITAVMTANVPLSRKLLPYKPDMGFD